ncbi:hypothetical protein [Streptosporangium subroseum]|uniref:hypothetical protein n=1 Tax=Streptosporangium subroseum TaxID=106412 RepID=UPI0030875D02|nr:hypothetical protein OHB15_23945 [Streptosporangium subroseum]
MLKHALAAGTLVASSLIVAMTMSAQPAGASTMTQEATSLSALPNNGGRSYHDPYDPYGPYGHVHHGPYGYGHTHYSPYGYGHVHHSPYGFHHHW